MKAVIMAGGFGTRLRPLTCNIPKPVVNVANRPIMEHILALLKAHGLVDVTAILYHQPEIIRDAFKDGSEFGVTINYVKTEADLGTAGAVKYSTTGVKDTFLVISGDVLTDIDLTRSIEFHKKKKSLFTIVLTRVPNPLAFGVVIAEKSGKITKFLEKPSWGEVFSDTVNTGIYIIEPEAMKFVPDNKEFDFSKNLFPILMENKIQIWGHVAHGYWRDVGNINEYRTAHY